MKKYITVQEHYCPFVEKNIVIERELTEGLENNDSFQYTNCCLNSNKCNCGSKCQNKLFDMDIKLFS